MNATVNCLKCFNGTIIFLFHVILIDPFGRSTSGLQGFRHNPMLPSGGCMAKEQLGKVDDILDLPFSVCCLELPSYQQLSGDPGVSLREGGGSEVLEESLHVPAALRPLLLDERNV